MREIKFRCWFGGKMYSAIPSIIFDMDGVRCVYLNHESHDFCNTPDTWTGKDDYHLMQFTGRKDKDGAEIYEGDIVPHEDGNYAIDFKDSAYGIDVNGERILFSSGWKVIGNIYENPELLINR